MYWRDFIKAGKAIFTLENTETGNRVTYKVNRLVRENKDIWFVSILNGSDNYRNYKYLGTIFGNVFRLTAKSTIGKDSMSYKAFNWLNNMFNSFKELPDNIKVHHEGRCGRCGKRLTVPSSIESGFGPECIKMM